MNSRYLVFQLLFLICISSILSAQNDNKKGYIIQNNLDTLYGYIVNKSYKYNSRFCLFKKDKKDSTQKFHPFDINSYRLADGKYYISKKLWINKKQEDVFLEYLVKGKANLYYMRYLDNDLYFIQKENDTIVPLESLPIYYYYDAVSDKYILYDAPTLQSVRQSQKYIGNLKAILIDAPELQTEIDKSTLDHASLIKITQDYHNMVCSDYSCIVYEKVYKPKFYIGVTPGYLSINYSSSSEETTFKDNNLVFTAFSFSFDALSIGEKSRIRIDMNFSEIDDEIEIRNNYNNQLISNIVTFSTSYQYKFLKQKLTPYLNIGPSIQFLYNTKLLEKIYSKDILANSLANTSLANQYNGLYVGGKVSLGAEYKISGRLLIDFNTDYMQYFNADQIKSSSFGIFLGFFICLN